MSIYFVLHGHGFEYEVQTAIQIFYPNRKYKRVQQLPAEGWCLVSRYEEGMLYCAWYQDGALQAAREKNANAGNIKKELKKEIYRLFEKITGYTPPWGNLTGIRPAKIVSSLWEKGLTDAQVQDYFASTYFTSPEKIKRAMTVAAVEKQVVQSVNPDKVSLYVGIPFCTTRCLYCSFPSYLLKQYAHKVDSYLDVLDEELDYIKARISSRQIQTVYVGGGTPTALNEKQLDRLLAMLKPIIGRDTEYTLEAGRPDTLTEEKFMAMKNWGVNRISINPQTMNQDTLERIGRSHTVEELVEAYETARSLGFENINMDMILGLPGEGVEEVENTLKQLQVLAPSGVTVHTLAVKRASRLREQLADYSPQLARDMEASIHLSEDYCSRMDMVPYYMYRQKNAFGSFENVGYALPGKECMYNCITMEENQTIIACGAGAVTKILYPGGRIERIFNVKSVDDYITRIDEMLKRKEKLWEAIHYDEKG